MPNDYALIEEIDLNGINRRIPIKRRLLSDDEKLYNLQRLWTSTHSKFVLVKKSEYAETNNNKAFAFRSLTRQKSIDKDIHEGKLDIATPPHPLVRSLFQMFMWRIPRNLARMEPFFPIHRNVH